MNIVASVACPYSIKFARWGTWIDIHTKKVCEIDGMAGVPFDLNGLERHHWVKPSCEAWEMQVVLKSVKSGSQTPIDDILVKEGQSYGGRRSSMTNYIISSRSSHPIFAGSPLFIVCKFKNAKANQVRPFPCQFIFWYFWRPVATVTPREAAWSSLLPDFLYLVWIACLHSIWTAVSYNVRYATRRIRFFRYYEELGWYESFFIIQSSLVEMIAQLPAVRSVLSVPYVMPGLEMMCNTQSKQLMSMF